MEIPQDVKWFVKDFVPVFIGNYSPYEPLRDYYSRIKNYIKTLHESYNRKEIESFIKSHLETELKNGKGKIYGVETTVEDVMNEISKHIDNPDLLPTKINVKFPQETTEPLTHNKHNVTIAPSNFKSFTQNATFLRKETEGETGEEVTKSVKKKRYYIFEVYGFFRKKESKYKVGDVVFMYENEPVAIKESPPTKGGKRRKRSTKRKTKKSKKSKPSKPSKKSKKTKPHKKTKTIRKRH